ncbi:hypothetical protein F4780DRAFT_777208 [Xylariomycetidae sp. FL0641]|nr:hypothetical protein F4780DRAFT_777208 [Xylariomycetidae sp. FL0641]
MARRQAFSVVLPLLFSMVAFILVMIALLAGTGPQRKALEGYHVIGINMSDFGHDLLSSSSSSSSSSTTTSSGSQPTETGDGDDGGIFSKGGEAAGDAADAAGDAVDNLLGNNNNNRRDIGDTWDDLEDGLSDLGDDLGDKVDELEDKIGDAINNATNAIADKLAGALGISEWYGLHMMTFCHGNFAPNATAPGAWFNTTNCTATSSGVRINLTKALDEELEDGPLETDLSSLLDILHVDFSGFQDAVDTVNNALVAMFALYATCAGLTGLSFLVSIGCLVILLLRQQEVTGPIAWINIAISSLATLMLAISSAVVTAISNKGVHQINDKGEELNISGMRGTKLIRISWVAFALMALTVIFWVAIRCASRRAGKRGTRAKYDVEDGKGFNMRTFRR